MLVGTVLGPEEGEHRQLDVVGIALEAGADQLELGVAQAEGAVGGNCAHRAIQLWPPPEGAPASDGGVRKDGSMSDEAHETEEMKLEQRERERNERRLAEEDPTDAGTAVHDRRAAKHAYLKEKLAEREESERATEDD